MKNLLAVALAALIVLTAASARNARSDDKETKHTDKTFVYKASASDLAEINLGRIAAKSGGSDSVKKFGQQMVDDHGKTSKELIDLANKKNLKVAPKMDDEHEKLSRKLAGLSGAEFDRAYMAGQVKDHEMAVSLFEKQSKDGSDKDLKTWAEKTLPHLRDHLKMAKEINDKLDGKGKDKRREDK